MKLTVNNLKGRAITRESTSSEYEIEYRENRCPGMDPLLVTKGKTGCGLPA